MDSHIQLCLSKLYIFCTKCMSSKMPCDSYKIVIHRAMCTGSLVIVFGITSIHSASFSYHNSVTLSHLMCWKIVFLDGLFSGIRGYVQYILRVFKIAFITSSHVCIMQMLSNQNTFRNGPWPINITQNHSCWKRSCFSLEETFFFCAVILQI